MAVWGKEGHRKGRGKRKWVVIGFLTEEHKQQVFWQLTTGNKNIQH